MPDRPPTLLIGITTRNRAHILPQALRSALAQCRPGITVAVLDDGSTDGTPALRSQFPQVRWERHESPQGIIESRNHLMRTAGTDYYLSLDDDAWFMRDDEIAVALDHLERHPRVGAIAYDILSPDRPAPVERGVPSSVVMFIGCGHIVRLSAVHEAGFYSPSPGTYGAEEKDLCYRLADLGYDIQLLPGVHVWHDKAWQDRDYYPIHRSGVCNELVMTMRRCPAPEVFAMVPFKIASFAWFWMRNPSYLRAGLAGTWFALTNLPRAEMSRRAVRRRVFFR